MTISVIVHKRTASAPVRSFGQQPALLRHIGESAIAVVVIKNVLPPIGDKQIVITVIVVVPDTDTLSPSKMRESGLAGHVGKGAVPVIVQQAVRVLLRVNSIQPGSIHQEHVEPTIVVVIDEGRATTGSLENIGVVGNATVDSRIRESRLGRNIFKSDLEFIPRATGARKPTGESCHAARREAPGRMRHSVPIPLKQSPVLIGGVYPEANSLPGPA